MHLYKRVYPKWTYAAEAPLALQQQQAEAAQPEEGQAYEMFE
jgi:hypothetical protein